MTALNAERDATHEHKLSLGEEIVRMEQDRARLEDEVVNVQSQHERTP